MPPITVTGKDGSPARGATIMIKIIKGAEVDGPKGQDGPRRHGMWAYHAPAYPEVCGYSRQPLLDACRRLKSLYGLTGERAGLFRKGSEVADISCPIEVGAATTVKEPDKGVVRFGKYIDLETVFDRVPEHLAARAGVGAA